MVALSRRELLALTAAAAVSGRAAEQSARSFVALTQGQERRTNITAALVAIDDQIRPQLRRKKYVLIKPNFVSVERQLAATHADAISGILDYLAPRFKGPVVIAEASARVPPRATKRSSTDRKSTRLNSVTDVSRMPSSA